MKFTPLALSATLVASAFASQQAEPRALGRRGDSDAPQWIKRSVQKMKRQGVVPNGALFLTVAANATATATAALLEAPAEVEIPTYNGTALWYRANNETGACRKVSTDEDLVVGIPSAFWPSTGVVSPLCGEKVVLYAGEKNVTATLLEASGGEYVSLSVGAFLALSPLTAGMISVQYQFLNLTLGASLNASLNATILHSTPLLGPNATLANPYLSLQAEASADDTPVAAVPAALTVDLPSVTLPTPTVTSSSVQAKPTRSSNNGASLASAQAASAQAAASQSAVKAQAQQATEQAAQQAKNDAAQAAQKVKDDAAWAASQAASSSSAAAAAASSKAAASAQSVKDAAASAASAAAAVVTPIADAASNVVTGGKGTYFYQNGVAGNCGKVHSESFKGIAIDHERYGNGENCWRMVEVTRVDTGATVVAQVVDNCPTCENSDSLDLSEGAFLEIATKAEGMVNISWKFLD